MNIDSMTVGELREVASLAAGLTGNPCVTTADNPFPPIGTNVFIRTVTHHHTGKLVHVGPQELVIQDAAWIASDGRFTDALATGDLSEVEVFPTGRVVIGRGALIDLCEWAHELPRGQK